MSVHAFGLPVPKETGGRQMRVKRVQCTDKLKIARETAYRLPLFLPSLLITCRDGCASAILARMMSGTLA